MSTFCLKMRAEPDSSVYRVADLRTGGRWFDPQPIFFPRIDDSHCDRINFSLNVVHCFNIVYVAKQPVTWKENYAEYWLKDLQESMVRCTGRRLLTEILLKKPLNTIQSTV